MSQISQPVRIILIGAVVFLAAWFTVLRPKAEEVPSTTTTTTPPASTPHTGIGKAVDAAKKVAGTKTDDKTAQPQTQSSATTTAPDAKPQAAAIAAVPAEALSKLPTDVADALKARHVVVLGVLSTDAKPWRSLPDDDRYVRNALKRSNRYDGKVFVKNIALDRLSGYGALVNDLGVNQSPSIVVIDRDLKGTVLTGYVDTVTINQAIADARRNSIEPDIKDPSLRQANAICGNEDLRISRWSRPTVRGLAARHAANLRRLDINQQYTREIERWKASAKHRGLKALWLKNMRAEGDVIKLYVKATKKGRTVAQVRAANKAEDALDWSKLDSRFNKVGLTDCAEHRSL